jgi:UDP-N-acetylglucosamine 2-epimerase
MTRNVYEVGDVMYDSVLFNMALATQTSTILQQLKLQAGSYYLATVHRAGNTDDPQRLGAILSAFAQVDKPVVLPLHPRTRKTLGDNLARISNRVHIIDPVTYLDMLVLEQNAGMVLTDSGGVQKEAYWLGVPCVILREETEWVELVGNGFSRLAGADTDKIVAAAKAYDNAKGTGMSGGASGIYGDGHSAEKTVALLAKSLS